MSGKVGEGENTVYNTNTQTNTNLQAVGHKQRAGSEEPVTPTIIGKPHIKDVEANTVAVEELNVKNANGEPSAVVSAPNQPLSTHTASISTNSQVKKLTSLFNATKPKEVPKLPSRLKPPPPPFPRPSKMPQQTPVSQSTSPASQTKPPVRKLPPPLTPQQLKAQEIRLADIAFADLAAVGDAYMEHDEFDNEEMYLHSDQFKHANIRSQVTSCFEKVNSENDKIAEVHQQLDQLQNIHKLPEGHKYKNLTPKEIRAERSKLKEQIKNHEDERLHWSHQLSDVLVCIKKNDPEKYEKLRNNTGLMLMISHNYDKNDIFEIPEFGRTITKHEGGFSLRNLFVSLKDFISKFRTTKTSIHHKIDKRLDVINKLSQAQKQSKGKAAKLQGEKQLELTKLMTLLNRIQDENPLKHERLFKDRSLRQKIIAAREGVLGSAECQQMLTKKLPHFDNKFDKEQCQHYLNGLYDLHREVPNNPELWGTNKESGYQAIENAIASAEAFMRTKVFPIDYSKAPQLIYQSPLDSNERVKSALKSFYTPSDSPPATQEDLDQIVQTSAILDGLRENSNIIQERLTAGDEDDIAKAKEEDTALKKELATVEGEAQKLLEKLKGHSLPAEDPGIRSSVMAMNKKAEEVSGWDKELTIPETLEEQLKSLDSLTKTLKKVRENPLLWGTKEEPTLTTIEKQIEQLCNHILKENPDCVAVKQFRDFAPASQAELHQIVKTSKELENLRKELQIIQDRPTAGVIENFKKTKDENTALEKLAVKEKEAQELLERHKYHSLPAEDLSIRSSVMEMNVSVPDAETIGWNKQEPFKIPDTLDKQLEKLDALTQTLSKVRENPSFWGTREEPILIFIELQVEQLCDHILKENPNCEAIKQIRDQVAIPKDQLERAKKIREHAEVYTDQIIADWQGGKEFIVTSRILPQSDSLAENIETPDIPGLTNDDYLNVMRLIQADVNLSRTKETTSGIAERREIIEKEKDKALDKVKNELEHLRKEYPKLDAQPAEAALLQFKKNIDKYLELASASDDADVDVQGVKLSIQAKLLKKNIPKMGVQPGDDPTNITTQPFAPLHTIDDALTRSKEWTGEVANLIRLRLFKDPENLSAGISNLSREERLELGNTEKPATKEFMKQLKEMNPVAHKELLTNLETNKNLDKEDLWNKLLNPSINLTSTFEKLNSKDIDWLANPDNAKFMQRLAKENPDAIVILQFSHPNQTKACRLLDPHEDLSQLFGELSDEDRAELTRNKNFMTRLEKQNSFAALILKNDIPAEVCNLLNPNANIGVRGLSWEEFIKQPKNAEFIKKLQEKNPNAIIAMKVKLPNDYDYSISLRLLNPKEDLSKLLPKLKKEDWEAVKGNEEYMNLLREKNPKALIAANCNMPSDPHHVFAFRLLDPREDLIILFRGLKKEDFEALKSNEEFMNALRDENPKAYFAINNDIPHDENHMMAARLLNPKEDLVQLFKEFTKSIWEHLAKDRNTPFMQRLEAENPPIAFLAVQSHLPDDPDHTKVLALIKSDVTEKQLQEKGIFDLPENEELRNYFNRIIGNKKKKGV